MKKVKRIKAYVKLKPPVCECYHIRKKVEYMLDLIGEPYYRPQTITVGECWGTREREECSCGGDTSKCTFYPEKRNK